MHSFTLCAGRALPSLAAGAALLIAAIELPAAPVISRLTPPSALFTYGDAGEPYISRFLPGQRFDLQLTAQPDADQAIVNVEIQIDGRPVAAAPTFATADAAGLRTNSLVASIRAYSNDKPGVHLIQARVTQSDGQVAEARGNFEIVKLNPGGRGDRAARNIIVCIGDGLGIAHRTAARIALRGVAQGKANGALAMDTFPNTALVITHSLNSIVTDSSPGAACYATGNKSNNNQQGVFPDDTRDVFDNPRVELIGEYFWRTQGKTLGIVTTSDVFDATPGAFGTHTANRGAGTGICDQYLDEAVASGGLRVLMGGGRKWFLPQGTPGSQRGNGSDYVLPADLAAGWGVAPGALDPQRDLIGDFIQAGFTYVADSIGLNSVSSSTDRLLGLFSFSNMNVAKDKLDKRRQPDQPGVVDDYGFPDQPMLDEMMARALAVLNANPKGFVLMVEAASIDKQAHNMDTERWLLDTIEFDRAVAVAQRFAENTGDTLVVVTADHECAGINIIGGSRVTNADLQARAAGNTNGPVVLRDQVVGVYESAGFPTYAIAQDGYPISTDPDYKMIIGYAGNADRFEDWLTNPLPLRDSQQPFNNLPPLNTYPTGPLNRDIAGNFFISGQAPGSSAVHTASDIPLSAFGAGASLFNGVMDNTEVFFRMMAATRGGTGSGK